MLDAISTAAYHLIANPIQMIYQMITKHAQKWSLKGISTLLMAAGCWPAGTTSSYEDSVLAAYLPTVPVPVHWKECFYHSAAEPGRELLKLPIPGFVQAK